MKNRQVDKNLTFQVRIDRGWWKILSHLKTESGRGFKELVEDALTDAYGIGEDGKPEIFINTQKRQAQDILKITKN